MQRFYAQVPREFWLGILTPTGVILLDILTGLIIGVGFSMLLLIYRASRPRISVFVYRVSGRSANWSMAALMASGTASARWTSMPKEPARRILQSHSLMVLS